MPSPLSGVLVVNKHSGISSAGALTRIKLLFLKPIRPKFGHAGTLDPFATGVLLVLIGKGTKRCLELMGQPKKYRATMKLGATTRTLDPTAEEIAHEDVDPTLKDQQARIENEIFPSFTGQISQVPPAFCALKQAGRPAYQFARQGIPMDLEPRLVTIYSLDLVSFNYPFLEFDVCCGKGTYIRSLACDIAAALGTTGYLTKLTRTAVGDYTLDGSVELDTLTSELLASNLRF